jgi:hypothetical protein
MHPVCAGPTARRPAGSYNPASLFQGLNAGKDPRKRTAITSS